MDALFIEDSIITIDAMDCQKSIAEKIIENKTDYLLTVKNNHKLLYRKIESAFSDLTNIIEKPYRYSREIDAGHGRIEQRVCYVMGVKFVSQSILWQDAMPVVMLESIREYQGEIETERRFYITSLKR